MYTAAVILFVMWLLGMSSSYDFGGFLHFFLFVAAATALARYWRDVHPQH